MALGGESDRILRRKCDLLCSECGGSLVVVVVVVVGNRKKGAGKRGFVYGVGRVTSVIKLVCYPVAADQIWRPGNHDCRGERWWDDRHGTRNGD